MTDKTNSEMVPEQGATIPVLNSQNIFGKFKEVSIEHEGEHYRLRITRLGKLILTK
ncbi:MAG: hemin uptake protein HemP [Pseudomonadota bacterium]